ncbi:hypothetical protein HID58_078547, partial [Brassica napus]
EKNRKTWRSRRDRLVRLGQDPTSEIPFTGNREITKIDDPTRPTTSSSRSIINQTIESSTTTEQDFFSCFAPQRCSPRPTSSSFLVKKKNSKKKVNGHGQLSLRLDRDEILLLRISRRSSQVSPPIYLRHKFKPRSRNDSSSRRQR